MPHAIARRQYLEAKGVLGVEICAGLPVVLVHFLSKQDFGVASEEDGWEEGIGLI